MAKRANMLSRFADVTVAFGVSTDACGGRDGVVLPEALLIRKGKPTRIMHQVIGRTCWKRGNINSFSMDLHRSARSELKERVNKHHWQSLKKNILVLHRAE